MYNNQHTHKIHRLPLEVLSLLLLIGFLTSCEREPSDDVGSGPYDTVIEGYITERGTGNPVEGAQIDLFGPAADGERQVYTDIQGFYRFDLGLQDNSLDFYIDFFGNDKYYNWPGEHWATKQGYNRIDGKLFAAGWVNLNLSNVDTWGSGDVLAFLHGRYYELKSRVDTTLLLEFPANEPWLFNYNITKQGITEFYVDTIYPIGHDTISHNIFY